MSFAVNDVDADYFTKKMRINLEGKKSFSNLIFNHLSYIVRYIPLVILINIMNVGLSSIIFIWVIFSFAQHIAHYCTHRPTLRKYQIY